MSEDGIETIIGRFGKYQTWILFLLTIGRLAGDFQLSNVVFLLPKTDYTCLDDGAQNATNFCPCEDPKFDTSTIETSITSDFNLICDKVYLSSLTQAMLQVGMAAGSLIFGVISDRHGRRKSLLLALLCNAVFGALSSFSTQLWMFIAFRFLSGFALGGTVICCFVYLIELSGKSFRCFFMGLSQLAYITAYIIQPIIAYYVRGWRDLQRVTCAPWLIVVLYYWLVPESPRWLITVGKKEEAVKVLTLIAKRNNRPVEDIANIVEQIEAESMSIDQQHRGSFKDLFKTPRIRKYSIITPFVWASLTLIYYGVNQYIGRLGGNFYVNVLLSALSLAPSPVLVVIAALYLWRKASVIVCLTASTVALLIFLIIPNDMESITLVFAIIGQFGAFGAFVLLYLFTSELYPTIIRNSAMGMCSMVGRIGGVLAPFVVNIGIEWVSISIFLVLAISSAAVTLLLPETKNIILFNSIEQVESDYGKNIKAAKCESDTRIEGFVPSSN